MAETKAPISILVVEDEPALQEAISFKLKQKGISVMTAKSGEEALLVMQEARQTWSGWISCFRE